MTEIVRIMGAADGRSKTPHDDRYVVSWNPHTKAGTLDMVSTDDPLKARRFVSKAEVMTEWLTVSKVQAQRPWDKRPNKPLTGLSIDIMKIDEND